MQVVGHDGKPVDVHAGIENRQFGPDRFYHPASIVQLPLAVNDLAKDAGAGLGNDGDKIGPALGGVVTLQVDGMAMVFIWVVFHTEETLRSRVMGPGQTRRSASTGTGPDGGTRADTLRLRSGQASVCPYNALAGCSGEKLLQWEGKTGEDFFIYQGILKLEGSGCSVRPMYHNRPGPGIDGPNP